ncbi:hypothetical protein SAMN05660976_03249 [Nonomuraea pusilla]|uniref:Uncharacterized protein n=2 Tax=Nonomuraea pusilla TaxID=46177 RepID=A0A1H7SLH2_9ACTN|nr:hypothetical protein SAMN05660976_03249 [Nonomuraea pusilla]
MVLAGPGEPRDASGVRLVEDLKDVAAQPPGSIVVLTRAASVQATGYRLDVALRDAAAAGAAALVLTGDLGDRDPLGGAGAGGASRPAAAGLVAGVARSAAALAERGGVTLALAHGADLAGLVAGLERAVAGDASDALARAARAESPSASRGRRAPPSAWRYALTATSSRPTRPPGISARPRRSC